MWFVRAVYLEEEGEVAEASEWSYGRYFSISSMPSAVEVEEAMRVLRRYAETHGRSGSARYRKGRHKRPAPSRLVAVQQQTPKSVTSAKTAIKATVSDATGETYGVVGISNSPMGRGWRQVTPVAERTSCSTAWRTAISIRSSRRRESIGPRVTRSGSPSSTRAPVCSA